MPIYAYECRNCRLNFERMQSITEEPVKICPRCGGQVRRVVQPVGIIFKGSGFYITDNRQISAPEKGGELKEGEKASKKVGSEES